MDPLENAAMWVWGHLADAWVTAHGWLFETVVQPALYKLGLVAWIEKAFDFTEVFMIGAAEIVVLGIVLTYLERWRPVETWTDRRAIRVDVLYTVLVRLGILPIAIFFLLLPLVDGVEGWLRLRGFIPPKLEDAYPALLGHPAASFAAYLILLDFAMYWIHRAQHRLGFWWALHAVHHSQREMTFWTDDRNHLLDMVFTDLALAALALGVGVPPGQFIFMVALSRAVESLAHANVRLQFGRTGEWLLVSPRFHRLHHAIGVGHEGRRYGCNFAVLFPVWDHLFGTANTTAAFPATGIRDQLDGRDYGDGFWRQQWLGILRMGGKA